MAPRSVPLSSCGKTTPMRTGRVSPAPPYRRRRMDYLARVRAEARDAYAWSNGPGDRYSEHQHAYSKLLYCTEGSIDFRTGDGRTISLKAGDRMVLPAG